MALPKRTLGQTGIQVSVLGFGASPLGGIFEVRCLKILWIKPEV
jgi:aryl-alcohol dehydrogenase-like predicted oxidoreductase